MRNTRSQVIYSRWADGHITFDGCSDTALGFKSISTTLVAHEYNVTSGAPQIRYVQCDLVGVHRFRVGTASIGRGGVVYDQCTRKNNRTHETFLQVVGTWTAPQSTDLKIANREDGDGIRP
ncbi:hypothetical protein ACFU3E_12625 [Streptomyces sp. NPDC057424]|uniref:hypothetical protein n=1 Tax=Streptomyces sp. NPDC057424 TaxID=3346127 RepID=UPI0036B40852